jgi:hypothetical protein
VCACVRACVRACILLDELWVGRESEWVQKRSVEDTE